MRGKYPILSLDGQTYRVRTLVYREYVGEKTKKFVIYTCSQSLCVNPKHLIEANSPKYTPYLDEKICCVQGCDIAKNKNGRCVFHYNNGDTAIRKNYRNDGKPCFYKEQGCPRMATVRGVCHLCRSKEKNGIDPMTGVMKINPVRSIRYGRHGYVIIYDPEKAKTTETRKTNGEVLEHRYVMAQHIGRQLLPGENVHHRNGVRDDNRIENLELWIVNQPQGQRAKDLLEWAEDIIRLYKGMEEKL